MPRNLSRSVLLAAAAVLFTVGSAAAQDGFLFDHPRVTVGLRVGHSAPAANGDIYDFITDELTVDRGDFGAAMFAGEISVRALSFMDVAFGLGTSASSQHSEFRDWLGEDDLPIEQTTRLRRTPITASLKLFPLPRGAALGSHAWIPQRFTPFVGGGAGVILYQLEQSGDFVDFETLDIFSADLTSDGSATTMHALAGADYWITPRVGLSAEGRYTWGTAELEQDFRTFSEIDLRGFQATAGLSFRF